MNKNVNEYKYDRYFRKKYNKKYVYMSSMSDREVKTEEINHLIVEKHFMDGYLLYMKIFNKNINDIEYEEWRFYDDKWRLKALYNNEGLTFFDKLKGSIKSDIKLEKHKCPNCGTNMLERSGFLICTGCDHTSILEPEKRRTTYIEWIDRAFI